MVRTIILVGSVLLFVRCSSSSGKPGQTGQEGHDNLPVKPQKEAWYKTVKEIPCPEGYERVAVDSDSFGAYLRSLPLKTDNNTVFLYNGQEKWNQNAQFAVIKMDIGKQDLQQCADAVMRLRGEYLYSHKRYADIHFNFLSDGKPHYYKEYVKGDYSYKKFRSYMNYIFSYANTASLLKELKVVDSLGKIMPGNVFIQKGNPYGHAIIVVDVARNSKTGEKIFMLAQSYMPAQETHILQNPGDENLSPWYSENFGEELETPEWTFVKKDLRRF
jgi:hypothetical protein